MTQSNWYAMMGISKLLLRNLVIGVISGLTVLCITLWLKNDKLHQDFKDLQEVHKMEIMKLQQESYNIYVRQDAENKELLKETYMNNQKIREEFERWKQFYQMRKK